MCCSAVGGGGKVGRRIVGVGECLGFLSRAPCQGAVRCSERRGRFNGVFQVLGGFP
jgi:hypothetical protein